MMKDSMIYFERMWQVMNACVGVPTLYAGSEFAQTGYETPNKNVYLGIRNEVLHDLQNDPRYAWYFKKMFETSGLYKKPGLSALRDGAPTSLNMPDKIEEIANQAVEAGITGYNKGKLDYFASCVIAYINKGNNKAKLFEEMKANKNNKEAFEQIMKKIGVDMSNPNDKNMEFFRKSINFVEKAVEAKQKQGVDIWPLYKKDSKGSETISIISNLGLPSGKASCEVPAERTVRHPVEGNQISLKDKDGKCPLAEDTILKRVGDNLEYIIKNGAIKLKDGGSLILTDTVTTFYVPKKLYF